MSFCYKDYKSAGQSKNITLDANEFIRRFLQHVLPKGFYKIRYFGFMAMCNARTKLTECLVLIDKASYIPVLEGLGALDIFRIITGNDPLMCPKCKNGRMRPIEQPVVDYLEPG